MTDCSVEFCTLCRSTGLRLLATVKGVPYWRCAGCRATLMDPAHWLDVASEKAVYNLHDNSPEDPGYRRFLGKLANPLLERLKSGSRGLDFGCGPGPVLAQMLKAAGMQVELYDPLFYPGASVLNKKYDFVTCTEVVEHLHDPAATFATLDRLLKPGGWLGLMTCFQTDDDRFANWHYRRDPTHVIFYREETLALVARQFCWTMEVPAKDVALFRKPL